MHDLPDNLWPYAILVFTSVFWTTTVQPHAGLSAAILPFAAAFTLLLSVMVILKHRETPRPAEWAAAITMIIFALVQFPAALFAYGLGPEQRVVAEMMYSHPTVLIIPAGFVGMAMFVIFMLASDVSVDMKEMAVRDQLTDLLNRREFGERSAMAYATARRRRAPVSVVMTDVIVRADRALYRSKRAGRNRVDLESSQLMRTIDGALQSVTQT